MSTIATIRGLLGPDVLLLPCHNGTKKSAMKWKHLTPAAMGDPVHLSRLNQAGNVAAVLGHVSGGLCSIDIDADDWVEPFLQKNSALRDTTCTKGARGCNFWVRIGGKYPRTHHIKQDGASIGEFRSDGSYTVIVGQHPSGFQYKFLNETKPITLPYKALVWPESVDPDTHPDGPTYQVLNPAQPVIVAFDDLLFPPGTARSIQQAWEGVDGSTRTERTERTEENKGGIGVFRRGGSVSLEEMLIMAKPNRKRTNHNCLFVLARGVLALEEERGKCYSRAELRGVFNQWYAAAQPYVRENLTSDDYFMEFLELNDYANTPLGSGTIDIAWELAQSEPPPPEAEQFDTPEYKLLTALCWHLQRLAGTEPFYLSTRTVQRVCGLETHTQAARRLRGLVRFGVLEEIEKGGPHTNKATRFVYAGG